MPVTLTMLAPQTGVTASLLLYSGSTLAATVPLTETPAGSYRYVGTVTLAPNTLYTGRMVRGDGQPMAFVNKLLTDASGNDSDITGAPSNIVAVNASGIAAVGLSGVGIAYGTNAKVPATIATGDIADLSAARAAKIDNLNATVASRATPADVSPTIAFNPTINPTTLDNTSIAGIAEQAAVRTWLANRTDRDAAVASPADVASATRQALFVDPTKQISFVGDEVKATGSTGGGTGTGNGDKPVDHDYLGPDSLRVLADDGITPADNVLIRAYVTSDYTAGTIDPKPPATYTGSDGRWVEPLMLDTDDYTLVLYNPATKRANTVTIEVA